MIRRGSPGGSRGIDVVCSLEEKEECAGKTRNCKTSRTIVTRKILDGNCMITRMSEFKQREANLSMNTRLEMGWGELVRLARKRRNEETRGGRRSERRSGCRS